MILLLRIVKGDKMSLTYCGIILNIMCALMRTEKNSNEYTDLLILDSVADSFNSSDVANVDELLKAFRHQTHLKVSLDDLYVYFSNMEVFKV